MAVNCEHIYGYEIFDRRDFPLRGKKERPAVWLRGNLEVQGFSDGEGGECHLDDRTIPLLPNEAVFFKFRDDGEAIRWGTYRFTGT